MFWKRFVKYEMRSNLFLESNECQAVTLVCDKDNSWKVELRFSRYWLRLLYLVRHYLPHGMIRFFWVPFWLSFMVFARELQLQEASQEKNAHSLGKRAEESNVSPSMKKVQSTLRSIYYSGLHFCRRWTHTQLGVQIVTCLSERLLTIIDCNTPRTIILKRTM